MFEPSGKQMRDATRYSKRLWVYLLALDRLLKSLGEIEVGKGNNSAEHQLEYILPSLREALASEIAFVANKKGEFLYIDSDKPSSLNGQVLHEKLRSAAFEGEERHAAADRQRGGSEYLPKGVDSVLVARFDSPWGSELVGVCNGKNVPEPYLGEDGQFLSSTMSIVALTMSAEQQDHASERYFWARLQGEWNWLARASEDHSLWRAEAKRIKDGVRSPRPALFDGVAKDTVVADYLDAELAKAMRDWKGLTAKFRMRQAASSKTTNGTAHDLTDHPDEGELIDDSSLASSLVQVFPNGNFNVVLHDNSAEIENLTPADYVQTACASARLYMWCGFSEAEFHVPTRSGAVVSAATDQQPDGAIGAPDTPPGSEVNHLTAEEMFWAVPKRILSLVDSKKWQGAKNGVAPEELASWLRAQWVRVHYLSLDGLQKPVNETIEEILRIYGSARALTIEVISNFLLDEPDHDLKVDSDWLMGWIARNAIQSHGLSKHHGLPPLHADRSKAMASPRSFIRYMLYLSELTLYVLHHFRHERRKQEFRENYEKYSVQFNYPPFADVPPHMSPDLAEAQLFILSEYAYHEIGVHRELRIFERLVKQLRFELHLYAASARYRDHLFHVMDVCLLGELLLRSILPEQGTRRTRLVERVARTGDGRSAAALLRNWYLAALCHDLGYVIEQAGALLEPAGEINGDGLDLFVNSICTALEGGKKAIRQALEVNSPTPAGWPKIDPGDFENVDATDHGIVAWLHLRHWLNQVKATSSYTSGLIAVLRHNLPNQHFDVAWEPLTWLLLLCDHVQDWGRPRVGPDPLARQIMHSLRFSEHPEFDLKVRLRSLRITGLRASFMKRGDVPPEICKGCAEACAVKNSDDWCCRLHTLMVDGGLNFILEHEESREGEVEPATTWLLLCRDLQCLGSQKDRWPLPIKITLKHGPSLLWHLLPSKPLEMDMLQDFASSCDSAAYLLDWVETARSKRRGIEYERGLLDGKETGEETFVIKLDELDSPLRRGLADEQWKSFFKWKWQRLRQQYLSHSLGDLFPDE